jgi:hypothetical protein
MSCKVGSLKWAMASLEGSIGQVTGISTNLEGGNDAYHQFIYVASSCIVPRVGHSRKFIKLCEKDVGYFFYSFVNKFIQFFDLIKYIFNYKDVCIKNKGII